MRVHVEVARRSFRRWSTYRAATVAGVFTNTVFGYLRAHVLVAVVAAGGVVGEWDEATLVTFAFVTQALLAGTGAFGEPELAERVRSGDVVVDLYRPVDLQSWWFSSWCGRAGFLLLARGVPPLLLGGVVFDLRLPASPVTWLAVVAAFVLASFIGFALRFLTNLTAFWLVQNQGLDQLVTLTLTFFGGLLVPLSLFPAWLEPLARVTPFAAMIQYPAEVFLGLHSGVGVLGVLALQSVWFAALIVAGRVVLGAAARKVELQGG
ncbi:MAG: ABC transporter permease [Acidimicrobiales bacterium]